MATIIDVAEITDVIESTILGVVNDVAQDAHDKALELVPIRKIFRTRVRKNGQEVAGRQDVRQLSAGEGNAEARIRGRLGLPSAFPQTGSGRRRSGSSPLVRTTLFPGNYRSLNRANDSRSLSRREVVTLTRQFHLGSRDENNLIVLRPEEEARLTARGRYELKNGRAIVRSGDELQLGGALRRTVARGFIPATGYRSVFKATIQAGNDERVKYAKYVEFGTRRSRAQPFLRPALAQARQEFFRRMVDALKGTL